MATSQYRQGAAFENRVKDRFEEAGYYVVRSAGSQGVADLVAFDLMADRITHHPVPIMIQCKRGKNGLGVEAWNHFYAIADAAGCLAVVAQKEEGRSLEACLWEIVATRTPRGRNKPWTPWILRSGDASPERAAPHLCKCGHGKDEHNHRDADVCSVCLCTAFRAW